MLTDKDIANQIRLNMGLLIEDQAPLLSIVPETKFDYLNLCGDCMLQEYTACNIEDDERFIEIVPVGKFYESCEGYGCKEQAHVKAKYITPLTSA